jgi:hypothetical protein
VVVKQEDTGVVVKQENIDENDNADNLDLDLPNIDGIFNGRLRLAGCIGFR